MKQAPIKLLVTLMLLTVAVVIVLRWPVSTLISTLASHGVQVGKVDGTAWRGQLKQVSYNQQVVDTVSYDMSLTNLLSGQLSAHIIAADSNGLYLTGQVAMTTLNSFKVSALDAMVPVTVRMGQNQLLMTNKIASEELSFNQQGQCISGAAQVRSAFSSPIFGSLNLDQMVLEGAITCENGTMSLETSETISGWEIMLQGFLTPKGLQGRLELKNDQMTLTPDVENMLIRIGLQKQSSGWLAILN